MTPQPTIARHNAVKWCYESVVYPSEPLWRFDDSLKLQWFQLLTDQSTVIPYYRYSGLNRDLKEIDDYLQAQDDAHFAYVDELLGDCKVNQADMFISTINEEWRMREVKGGP